jgi:hypothetical protein
MLTLSAAVAAVAASAFSGPSQAHDDYPHPHRNACVKASYGAVIYPPHPVMCNYAPCGRRVSRGRAFRVRGHKWDFLFVSHLETEGWIEARTVRWADERYCRAAGI